MHAESTTPFILLPAILAYVPVQALVDSGATHNFTSRKVFSDMQAYNSNLLVHAVTLPVHLADETVVGAA